MNAHDFRCFFTTGSAWGVFSQKAGAKSLTATLELKKGTLDLSQLRLKPPFVPKSVTATLARRPVDARVALRGNQVKVVFPEIARPEANRSLDVVLSSPGL